MNYCVDLTPTHGIENIQSHTMNRFLAPSTHWVYIYIEVQIRIHIFDI